MTSSQLVYSQNVYLPTRQRHNLVYCYKLVYLALLKIEN